MHVQRIAHFKVIHTAGNCSRSGHFINKNSVRGFINCTLDLDLDPGGAMLDPVFEVLMTHGLTRKNA